MPKVTNEDKDILKENLQYIGLNLEKVPKFLQEFEPLNYRPLKLYNDKTYKVYRYVNIKDIEILITPTDRLADLKEKYKLATPIATYLDSKSEQNIERFATFLKMLSTMRVDVIEAIEKEQQMLKKQIPYHVKYENHYMWQVYYSDYAKKYFMLVPTNEYNNNALFYLLKKQIEQRKTRKKELIFIPISHMEYSGAYLTSTEISDIENYLWFFTKDWASVYEVYNEKNQLSIHIVGTTKVYEKIKSDYKVELCNKDEAMEFYKLLKALFILATAAPEDYKFKPRIADEGKLDFSFSEQKMVYANLPTFINTEYQKKVEELNEAIEEKKKAQKKLQKLKKVIEELIQEYLIRQNQIATFLECKKTFFGKVRYYFKKKKDTANAKTIQKEETKGLETQNHNIDTFSIQKEQYTIEDLINVCSKLERELKENSDIYADINAMEIKQKILTKKKENAELYIKEIDSHKKSIFEFWRFTSKDEVQTLNEGEDVQEAKKEKISKFFDYESDLEDFGKIVDEVQRRKLSKNETDAIFAAKQVPSSVKAIIELRKNLSSKDKQVEAKQTAIIEKELEDLKEEYKNNLEYINMKDFDIFGAMSEDKTKIKTIGNERHREIAKDRYKVLNVNLDTELAVYMENLEGYVKLIEEALHKIQAPYNMSVYMINHKKSIDNNINICNIKPEDALKQALEGKKEEIILARLNIKEGMPIVFYTNIIFYDNYHKTLPLGMNLSSEVLLNTDELVLNYVKEESFNINCIAFKEKVSTKKITVYEYDVSIKKYA